MLLKYKNYLNLINLHTIYSTISLSQLVTFRITNPLVISIPEILLFIKFLDI